MLSPAYTFFKQPFSSSTVFIRETIIHTAVFGQSFVEQCAAHAMFPAML